MTDKALSKLGARELRRLYREGGAIAARVYWVALARDLAL